ncbi:MAG: CoA pyrophosphatase [Chloroflexi bacterium]|nr:CoA pyrophosphatase [Chloroflexota bacterium]
MTVPLTEALKGLLAQRTPRVIEANGAHDAAVLLLVDQRPDDYYLLLTVRSNYVRLHKGEIAFAGGRPESVDSDLQATALRETWEEIGIQENDVTVLGQLDPVLTRTDFLVTPYVGLIPYPYTFTTNDREVGEVLEVPLDSLLDPANTRHETRVNRAGVLDRRHAYAFGSHLIYGATAWIMTQFLDMVATVKLQGATAEVSL